MSEPGQSRGESVRPLKEVLGNIPRRVVLPWPKDFAPRAMQEVARQLENELGEAVAREIPSTDNLLEAHREFERCVSTRSEVASIPWRLRRWLPYLLFHKTTHNSPVIAETPKLLELWLHSIESEGSLRARAVASAIRHFLGEYPRGSSDKIRLRENIGRELRRLLDATEGPRLTRWREYCDRFHLLEPEGLDACVEHWFNTAQAGLAKTLSDVGLEGTIDGPFALEMRRHAMTDYEVLEFDDADLEAFLRDYERIHPPDVVRATVEALLEPYSGRLSAPSKVRQELLLREIDRLVGDPRLHEFRWRQRDISDDARQVYLRWRMKFELESFFEIIGAHAVDRMWSRRRDFWMAYWEAETIRDVWVAYGRNPAQDAQRTPLLVDKFAAVTGEGDATKSAILLKISGPRGSAWVAEWSHNGKCGIWVEGYNEVPWHLYEKTYSGHKLRGAPWERVHDAYGHWCDDVAQEIRNITGIHPPQ